MTQITLTSTRRSAWESMSGLFSVFNKSGAYLLFVMTGLTGLLALIVAGVIILESWPALEEVPLTRFFTDDTWHPTLGDYDMKPMIIGSILSAVGAVGVAMPVGVCIAVFVNFYALPKWAGAFRKLMYVTTAVPTVVFGFWGLSALVPVIGQIKAPGVSLLAGIIVLSLMIIPTVAMIADMAIAKVPSSMINGAFALGASKHSVCFGVAVVVARGGIISAGLLGLGRALGETIAVAMVTGNKTMIPQSLLDPIRTLTANVAMEMGYADPLHRSVLFVSAFILILLVSLTSILVLCRDGGHHVDIDV